MPDRRRHRGPHPTDRNGFTTARLPKLRTAVSDLSWLLTRGYSDISALKIVGDRYELTVRQRQAVMRSSCADRALAQRQKTQVELTCGDQRPLFVDGYNLLITLESALSGGLVLIGRDGCTRDLASLHGTYRTVEETVPALELIGHFLAERHDSEVTWYLDAPVSNSARLATLIRTTGANHSWRWSTQVVGNPDPVLAAAQNAVVASSDSWIIDRAETWTPLSRTAIEALVPDAWIEDLTIAD